MFDEIARSKRIICLVFYKPIKTNSTQPTVNLSVRTQLPDAYQAATSQQYPSSEQSMMVGSRIGFWGEGFKKTGGGIIYPGAQCHVLPERNTKCDACPRCPLTLVVPLLPSPVVDSGSPITDMYL